MKKIKIVDYLGQQEARAKGMTYEQYQADLQRWVKLGEFTAKMKVLCASLRKADSLSKKELNSTIRATSLLDWDFESAFMDLHFQRTFHKDVPADTQNVYRDLCALKNHVIDSPKAMAAHA